MHARSGLVLWAAALALLCLAAGPCWAAGKRALLVGIDAYPFVREPALQLHGARTDVEQMGLVLQYCGFDLTTLENGKATGAAIRQALRVLSDGAGAGDEVVFYFSGRGSVAYDPRRPAATRDLEPTLVPADGQAGSAAGDVPLGELEAWARELTAKNAAVTIFLDACYSAPAARDLEDRFYKNVPRCVRRPGSPRAALYNGPGVLLAATDARGLAFEWRVDFSSGTWAGAFTDLWTNAAMRRLRQGPPPTYAEVMGDVHRFFAARTGYMSGMRPYPPADRIAAADAAALYGRPVFAAPAALASNTPPVVTAPPPVTPPAVEQKIDAIVAKRREQEKTLRVALDAPAPPAGAPPASAPAGAPTRGARDPEAVLKPFGDYLRKRLEMVAVLPRFVERPDRILVVRRAGDGWEVEVQGDEVDVSRHPVYRGRDANAVMAAGLADYLQRQAYALRLFRLAEPGGARPDWSIRSDKPTYRPGDRFAYVVETPRPGQLYILDWDEKDGIVQMVFPLRQEPDNGIAAGAARLPRTIAYQIPPGVAGRTHTRALLVAPSPALKLPALPDAKADPAAYARVERDHLRALVRALEQKKAIWSAIDFDYAVTE